MADNTTLNAATVAGGNKIYTEDMGGNVHIPGSKFLIGNHGVNDGPVSTSNPLPITFAAADLIRDYVNAGRTIWSNVSGDFTATANNGTKTITLSSYASAVLSAAITSKNFMLAMVKRKKSASTNQVDFLPTTRVAFSANVLTLEDMTDNFDAGDEVAVTLVGPDKSYDETNDADRVNLVGALLATFDSITAKLSSEHVMVNGVELTPKWAYKSALASSGNNEVVALVASKKIRVLAYRVTYSGSVNSYFRTSTAGAQLDVLQYGSAGVKVEAPFNPLGHFETVAGQALGINLSTAQAVDVWVQYVEV